MRIALLYNQKPADESAPSGAEAYCEWDTPETIRAVAAALRRRHEVREIDCHPGRLARVVADLQEFGPDLCFNMAEGAGAASREAQIPALLDLLGLRYTASDALTLALALDKARTKEVLAYHGIPTPAFHVFAPGGNGQIDGHAAALTFPLVVKPLHEGSSKGIFERSLVATRVELDRQVAETWGTYAQPALVEEFLPGREFTVGLVGNGHELEVLPLVEIDFTRLPAGARPLYGYEAKWVWDTPARAIDLLRCPAAVAPELEREIADLCRRTFAVMRCRDWARIDLRLDARGRPQVLEINPLPGILPDRAEHSALPLAARVRGWDYPELILRVVDTAMRRYGIA